MHTSPTYINANGRETGSRVGCWASSSAIAEAYRGVNMRKGVYNEDAQNIQTAKL
jgi:hypothetical protein